MKRYLIKLGILALLASFNTSAFAYFNMGISGDAHYQNSIYVGHGSVVPSDIATRKVRFFSADLPIVGHKVYDIHKNYTGKKIEACPKKTGGCIAASLLVKDPPGTKYKHSKTVGYIGYK